MIEQTKVFITDSYFNIFNILRDNLQDYPNGLNDKTLIFCEDKISLLAENTLCDVKGGTFSADVYSFAGYLRKKINVKKALSKEGSTMVLRKILKEIPLKRFSKSRNKLALSVYELIALLKSAKILPSDIKKAVELSNGILRNKLEDVYSLFLEYEKYISENGFDDQSSLLSYLPKILESDSEIKNTDVILLGYTSITKQALAVIEKLLKNAKSVTLIATGGENSFVFVNEVEKIYTDLCSKLKIKVVKKFENSNYCSEAKLLTDNMFNPSSFLLNKTDTDKIKVIPTNDTFSEIQRVGEIIKSFVMENGLRYCDFSIAVPDSEKINFYVSKIFKDLSIPYFLDVKKKGKNTALVSLILSYIDVFQKNMERNAVCSFFKNPLFSTDKDYNDALENYLIRYNVNYSQFKEPFVYALKNENIEEFNKTREKLVDIFSRFNVRQMLEKLCVKEKHVELSNRLKELKYVEEGAVNDQIYGAVTDILDDMDLLLGSTVSFNEFREVFISGIEALELSILPQYKDAVFIGDYKETAILQNKYIFALELNSDVPMIKEDVAILSDTDIEKLENIKILIDPKVKIVNRRSKENVAMALSAFSQGLFLCCPTSIDGKKSVCSEVFTYIDCLFNTKKETFQAPFLTEKQGLENFGKNCSYYAEGKTTEFSETCNYYYAMKDKGVVENILNQANREIKPAVIKSKNFVPKITSPTTLEKYSDCPYSAFLSLYLKVSERDTGEVSYISVGILTHEVFEKYVKKLDFVFDEKTSDKVVEEILSDIFKRAEYNKFLKDDREKNTVERIKEEVKEYCYKIYKQFKNSDFKPIMVEQSFGSDKKGSLPPINLLDGKVKLKGKIDRVDGYKNYVRIIDYKTGKCDDKKENLFSGSKLQLYLYSKVFQDKEIAGTYYMPISNKFISSSDKQKRVMLEGDSLNEKEILISQDKTIKDENAEKIFSARFDGDKVVKAFDKDVLAGFSDYAFKISENIISLMSSGFIPASPLEGKCDNCPFVGICESEYLGERQIGKVDGQTIIDAVTDKEKE